MALNADWEVGDLVIIRHDRDWWINSATGQLVEHWRFEDPERQKAGYNGKYAYPGPCPLWHRPGGGGSSRRIPQRWLNKVEEMNKPEFFWTELKKCLMYLNYGWVNYKPNMNDYPDGGLLPYKPDPLPLTEAITSIYNIHRVAERSTVDGGRTRIEAYRYSDPVPDEIDFYKMCDFSSINSKGEIAWMGSKFPLLVAEQAWIPDYRLKLYLPKTEVPETRMKGSVVLSWIEGSPIPKVRLLTSSEDPGLVDKMIRLYKEEKEQVWFHWPTEFPGEVTQSFGNDPAYYGQFDCGGEALPGHEGLDLRAFIGTEIYCCYDGVITRVEHIESSGGAYGIQVRVSHDIGGVEYKTTYAHLQAAFDWEVEDEVKRGEVLGLADNTGNSFGSHLHLTLKRMANNANGWPCNIINPTPFFKELQEVKS